MGSNMTTNEKMIDAIRTTGQLLLHRSTSGVMSRDSGGQAIDINRTDAAYFCYVGACKVVEAYMLNHEVTDDYANCLVWKACDKVIGRPVEGNIWDSASPKQRKAWATKLANFQG